MREIKINGKKFPKKREFLGAIRYFLRNKNFDMSNMLSKIDLHVRDIRGVSDMEDAKFLLNKIYNKGLHEGNKINLMG